MKDWYMLNSNTRPNSIGGYENDSFVDYKEDAFMESLETDIASSVILYNHDLSISKKIRCVIQDNVASTYLKSMERTILTPIGTLKAGMYIYFEDCYWLIVGYPGNNKVYEKSVMLLCQYKIKWQDNNGKIIERYANFTSASKYDVGEFISENIILKSNNFTILIPEDDDSATLDGKRIYIDRNISNPTKVFKITRSDDVLYLYGANHGGILSFISDKDEMNIETDRPDIGICDYVENNQNMSSDTESDLYATINGSDSIKVGYDKAWSVTFFNKLGKEIPYDSFEWNIVSDFYINNDISKNIIELQINNEDYIGSSFLLQIIINNVVVSEKSISVIEGF